MEDELIAEYLTHMRIQGMHSDTIADYETNLREYGQYLAYTNNFSIFDADADIICGYAIAVKERRVSASTTWKKQHAVYAFYDWLQQSGRILLNPARKPASSHIKRLPRGVPSWITLKHVYKRLRRSPRFWEQRDFSIIDLAYSCGLRRRELAGLNVDDIDEQGATIRVKGKGGRKRVVPIGPRALKDLLYYIYHIRPRFLKGGHTKALFLSWISGGKRMHPYSINAMFDRLRLNYGFERNFQPHNLRHAFATDLIRNGAPVQDVSKMLGHVKLETTQIYTRLLPMDLKRQHERFHPRG
jgi:site-specific recombinase XerD